MFTTPAFIPPPVVPLIPGAANAIIPTAGVLGGAVAGARAGAFLGPKGAVIGGLLGGLLFPLLFPPPTAPGTLDPDGLDPGLNDPEPSPTPAPSYPDRVLPFEPKPGDPSTATYTWRVYWNKVSERGPRNLCNGDFFDEGYRNVTSEVKTFTGRSLEITNSTAEYRDRCQEGNYFIDKTWWQIKRFNVDGSESVIELIRNRDGFRRSAAEDLTIGASWYGEVLRVTRDDEELPVPELPVPEVPTKPRPLPIPVRPLTPDPVPYPEPGPEPQPEPEPQPDPLRTPQPGDPTAPPVTIPRTPPAIPQTPPKRDPKVVPLPYPIEPGVVPTPLPVPGIPTVPEPNPDPSPQPVPGPTPLPSPGPAPTPDIDPEPGETPTPGTPNVPRPTIPGVAPAPDTSRPTLPDGSIVPQPQPQPQPTPPNAHFPVTGQPPVTDGGVRPNLDSIAAEVGRIEQKVARTQQNTADIPWWLIGPILEALGALLEQDIPGTTYQLQGVCETPDSNGNQPVAEFEVEPAKNLGAIINRLDTIDAMLQQHLAWKTPTCKSTITPVGDWRTISFISDEVSPYGKSRLRKRFRYRSVSGVGLSGVIDHWKDFVWDAGPVCVQHAGSSWGTPQCWASSVDEGKRVIRHAAGEAGIDPDQDGRWVISGSDSPRVGVPGTMRVNRAGGYYWITARDGSEGRPLVGKIGPAP